MPGAAAAVTWIQATAMRGAYDKTMTSLPRTLNPSLNATGYMAAAGAVFAAAVMIWNATHHHGVISVPVILAAITATGSLLTRQVVTPVADPVDGAGRTLVPVADAAPALAGTGSVLDCGAPDSVSMHAIPPDVIIPPQPIGVPRVIIEDAPAAPEPPAPVTP